MNSGTLHPSQFILWIVWGVLFSTAPPIALAEVLHPQYPEVESTGDDAESGARIAAIRDRMNSVIIDQLDIRDLNMRDAIGALQEAARSGEYGFSFILAMPDTESLRAKTAEPSRLLLKNVSLPEALNQICLRYSMVWSCEGKILIRPEGTD